MSSKKTDLAHQNVPGRCLRGDLVPEAGRQVWWLEEVRTSRPHPLPHASPGSRPPLSGAKQLSGSRGVRSPGAAGPDVAMAHVTPSSDGERMPGCCGWTGKRHRLVKSKEIHIGELSGRFTAEASVLPTEAWGPSPDAGSTVGSRTQ